MSRKIKFRIWLKDEEKYIPSFVEDNDAGDGYGPLEYDNYYLAPETGAVIKHHNHREFGDWMYSVEGTNADKEVNIEQYTGLNDRNGKEIYEGDVVKCWDDENGEVYFCDISLQYRVKFTNGDDEDLASCEAEIIGNIHENPELLEAKNE